MTVKYTSILFSIAIYYFLIGTVFYFVSVDPMLIPQDSSGNFNYTVDTSNINTTAFSATEDTKVKDTFQILFGFSTPTPKNVPQPIPSVISFINWALLVLAIICIYRIANPLS